MARARSSTIGRPSSGPRQTGSPRWGTDEPWRLPGCVAYERPLARVAAAIAAARARGGEASDMKEVELLLRSMGSPHVWPRVWMLEGRGARRSAGARGVGELGRAGAECGPAALRHRARVVQAAAAAWSSPWWWICWRISRPYRCGRGSGNGCGSTHGCSRRPGQGGSCSWVRTRARAASRARWTERHFMPRSAWISPASGVCSCCSTSARGLSRRSRPGYSSTASPISRSPRASRRASAPRRPATRRRTSSAPRSGR